MNTWAIIRDEKNPAIQIRKVWQSWEWLLSQSLCDPLDFFLFNAVIHLVVTIYSIVYRVDQELKGMESVRTLKQGLSCNQLSLLYFLFRPISY